MASSIKFVNLVGEYKLIKKEINTSIRKVLDNGIYILGPEVEKFENKFSKYIGTKFAVGLASGTDALTLAIKSLGLKKDQSILMPANVYPTVFGVALSGVNIKLSDVNYDSSNIDIENVKKNYTKDVKAILVVHLYGNPVDLAPIIKFCKEKKLYLIEDCAQAAGSLYKGKKVGLFGDVSCFSFYPTKNLGTYGDGGAVLTNNKDIYERVKSLRMYGERGRYNSVELGQNSRLDEIHAAILNVKLKYLDKWNLKRHKIAKLYDSLISAYVSPVVENKSGQSNYHLYVVRTENRDELMNKLKAKNIPSVIHYPLPIHKVKSFSYLGYKEGDFPITEKLCNTILSLPIYPEIEKDDIVKISKLLK